MRRPLVKFLALALLSFPLMLSPTALNPQTIEGKWTGTIRMEEIHSGGITGSSKKTIVISIRNNSTQGTLSQEAEIEMAGKTVCKSICSGAGKADLHVATIDKQETT